VGAAVGDAVSAGVLVSSGDAVSAGALVASGDAVAAGVAAPVSAGSPPVVAAGDVVAAGSPPPSQAPNIVAKLNIKAKPKTFVFITPLSPIVGVKFFAC
jgi:hypothetical protein